MTPKEIMRKVIPSRLSRLLRAVVYPEKIGVLEERLNNLFLTRYQNIAVPTVCQKTVFRNSEFKIYSKHGCDGLLLHIFSQIGIHSHTFVEMGVEDGRECNTANLSLNLGWKGLLIDANTVQIESAKKFYSEKLGTDAPNVKIVDSFVTAENINSLINDNGISGEIDLLSIDIDSNDYWVWKNIHIVNPRVVVIEYNAAFGSSRSFTIKYDPHFHKQKDRIHHPLYFGASLSALTKLGKEKGYVLVGCDTHGHDAYFVRRDVIGDKLIEMPVEKAFYSNPYTISHVGSLDEQFDLIKNSPLEEI